jgi:hypothetical protein
VNESKTKLIQILLVKLVTTRLSLVDRKQNNSDHKAEHTSEANFNLLGERTKLVHVTVLDQNVFAWMM